MPETRHSKEKREAFAAETAAKVLEQEEIERLTTEIVESGVGCSECDEKRIELLRGRDIEADREARIIYKAHIAARKLIAARQTSESEDRGVFDGEMKPAPKGDADKAAAETRAATEKLTAARIDQRRAIRKAYPDLRRRAAALNAAQLIDFADISRDPNFTAAEAKAMASTGQTAPTVPTVSDINLHRLFDALFVGGEVGEVHYDTSRRTLVDENAMVIDDAWDCRDLLEAARSLKMRGGMALTVDLIIKSLRNWSKSFKFNDISERVRSHLKGVEWDGVSRLESYLIETLGMVDSADNRLFSKYWALGLYNRVMYPGCLNPIAAAIFGSMDAGKSYFQKRICEELLFNPTADAVTYDPNKPHRDLCRDIYGISIIATIPEMTGFGKADLKKMKAFQTSTTDTFDQKFGFSGAWPRQFINTMDANLYEGLWRDGDDLDVHGDSQGERRHFPIFVGEIAGATGPVRWTQGFRVNFGPEFAARLWQAMKECEIWMAQNGMDAYISLVHETTAMVMRFSRDEKNAGRGTVKDATFEENFPSALYRAIKRTGVIGWVKVGEQRIRGLRVLNKDIVAAYEFVTRRQITPQKVTSKMKAIGAKSGRAGSMAMNVSAFVFDNKAFGELVDGREEPDLFVDLFVKLYASDGGDIAAAATPETDGQSESEAESESRDGF